MAPWNLLRKSSPQHRHPVQNDQCGAGSDNVAHQTPWWNDAFPVPPLQAGKSGPARQLIGEFAPGCVSLEIGSERHSMTRIGLFTVDHAEPKRFARNDVGWYELKKAVQANPSRKQCEHAEGVRLAAPRGSMKTYNAATGST